MSYLINNSRLLSTRFLSTRLLSTRFLCTAALACVIVLTGCAQEADGREPAADAGNYSASIVVAGGCFWCVEADLEKLDGVGDVLSGYAGGNTPNPTYQNHSAHLEVVEAPYDPSVISYRELVDYFLRHIDPLDAGGQFCDRGHSYTTAIFYRTSAEQSAAQAAVASAQAHLGEPIVTPILPLSKFWIAEDYHQNYYKVNPLRYKYYRNGCGRDDRVTQVWSAGS